MATAEPPSPPPPGHTNRALIAYDGRIFMFQTGPDDRLASASPVRLVYVPKEQSSICVRFHGKEVTDYLALEDARTSSNGMFTTLKPVRCLNGKLLKFDSSKFHSLYQNRAKVFTAKSPISLEGFSTQILRENISYSSNNKDWKLCLTNFTGFPHTIHVEYAPSRKIYIERCSTYGILKENCPKLIVHEQKVIETTTKTKLTEGSLDNIPVVVKETDSKRVTSDYIISAMIQRVFNKHDNLVRVYDSGCHGHNYFITMEKCTYDLANTPKDFFENPERIKIVLSKLSSAIAFLHEHDIVHGRIRPCHVLLKFDGDSVIPKLCGMGSSKFSLKSFADCSLRKDPGLFAKDIYCFARTAFNCVSGRSHKFLDSDEVSDNHFLLEEKFMKEMNKLSMKDPIAHDLVHKLLRCKSNFISAKDIVTHSFFWMKGMYLKFLTHVSDITNGSRCDKILETSFNLKSQNVFGKSWKSLIDSDWFDEMSKSRKRKRDDDTVEYDCSKISSLLLLVRNTVYHPEKLSKQTWEKIGGIDGFEGYITKRFPLLFMTVYNVAKSQSRRNIYLKEYFNCPF